MRLLDDDTFLPLPPPEKNSRKSLGYIDKSKPKGWEDDEEEDDDEDEKLIRKAMSASKSKFKTDSFVTLDEGPLVAAVSTSRDLSPPRHRSKVITDHNDEDKPAKRKKHKQNEKQVEAITKVKQEPVDSDASPSRQKSKVTVNDSDIDLSPPRAKRKSSRHDEDEDGDLSPARQKRTGTRRSRSPLRVKQEPGISWNILKFNITSF